MQEARQAEDWKNGAIAGGWTGLFFGKALRDSGKSPWRQTIPGAIYAALGSVCVEQLLRYSLQPNPSPPNPVIDDPIRREAPIYWWMERLWPTWLPAHPKTFQYIDSLTQRVSELTEEIHRLTEGHHKPKL